MILIGLVQACASEDPEVNLQTLLRFSARAAGKGCQAICFPEAFLTGYAPEEAELRSIPAEGPLTARVLAAARELGIDILTGFLERAQEGVYITHGLFRRDGTAAFYRKTHLGSRERRFFRSGGSLEVFPLSCGLAAGIQLCVECHHPRITQTLALKGARVVFAPHAVPRAAGDRQRLWRKYIPARSYDNRVYMACCNLWDPDRFGGGCLVTDPRGEETASLFEEGPGLLVCPLDPELPAMLRTPDRFYPGLGRPELYL